MPVLSSSTFLEDPSHPLSASPLKPQTLLLQWNSVFLLLAIGKIFRKEKAKTLKLIVLEPRPQDAQC